MVKGHKIVLDLKACFHLIFKHLMDILATDLQMKLLQKFRCVCGEWGQNLKEEVNGDLGRSVCTYRDELK